jgi:orotidine-5'-phosphate decarboxylase
MAERYAERLQRRVAESGSHLCVGLDPRVDLIQGDVGDFLRRVVQETAEHAAAFKPNIAYFEAMGSAGFKLLEDLLAEMPSEVPVVLDVKRSDIGETQKHYAKAYFENWDVDAVTLNAYLGFDTIEPFLQYEGKGVYLLGVTSNPGAADMELRQMEGRYAFEHVQDMAGRAEGLPGDVGLVVGLTNISNEVLSRVIDAPLLIPGFGAQGGSLDVLDPSGRQAPLLINSSRGILFAEPEKSFTEKAEAAKLSIEAALAV